MAKRLAARNGGLAGLALLSAILALGFGLRVENALKGREPVFDAAAYATIAANIERGDGFTLGRAATQPATNYSPGLPLFVAGLYELSGGIHERFARLVLAAIGTLTVLFTYLIGRRLCGSLAGLIGASAIAIYPALLEYQGMLMGEPLASSLLAGGVLATLWAAEPTNLARGSCRGGSPPCAQAPAAPSAMGGPLPPHHPRVRCLLPGALFGGLALVRPEYLLVTVLIALVVALRDWRRSVPSAIVLLLGAAIVVVPWTVRNAIDLHRFVPVSTGGGQVLFAGSYLPSGGDPERVGAEVVERHPGLFAPDAAQHLRLEQILARLAAHRYPGLETDKALSRMGRERLGNAITEEPLAYLSFVANKVGRIWAHGPRDVMRVPIWEILHWLLLALGLLGLAVLAAKGRWEALLLATIFLAITAISAVLVASPRRVLVMMPLVASLAGVGVARIAWRRP